jgi:polyisoprenoid-binding protein YceI
MDLDSERGAIHLRVMRCIAFVAALALGASPALAWAEPWTIDAGHSQVGFAVRHLLLSNVRGHFSNFSGMVDLDERDISKSKVEVEIDASTITTENDARDKHLRSADFLNADKTPKITFKSTRVERAGKGRLRVIGDLTIRETTKSVVLDVEGPGEAMKDPWGMMRRSLTAAAKINRQDFGLSWHKSIDNGVLVAADEVAIVIEAELVQGGAPKK